MITLRPGLLVSLKTTIGGGNVDYAREELGKETETDGAKVEEWKTRKTVIDPAELERATKTRSKCRSLISSVCSRSEFGLLCLGDNEKKLDEAIKEARALAAAFNENARLSRVSVFILKGRIAENDAEAARAINGEMQDLLNTMEVGIKEADVAKIRNAANDAKKIGKMLDEKSNQKVSAAIEEAREVAKQIVKKLTAGDDVADLVQSAKLDAMAAARFAFLDSEDDLVVAGEQMAPTSARVLDTDDEPEQMAAGGNDAPAMEA